MTSLAERSASLAGRLARAHPESLSVPLVGRDLDIAVISAFVDQAAVHGGALVVSGEPGVGKTAPCRRR
jgi:MoxR-like ATPase